MTQAIKTRDRLMDIAEASVLQKGFNATSIEELVTEADITKSGFFYHFRDKNELALALVDRYIERDDQIFHDIHIRSCELSDDPLQQYLIGLKLLAELAADFPGGHPGCLVASICYQERLFDKRVIERNKKGMLAWRYRFREQLERVMEIYPPREDVDLDTLADMISSTVEGGIIMSKALQDPSILPAQILLMRSYIKFLFLAKPN